MFLVLAGIYIFSAFVVSRMRILVSEDTIAYLGSTKSVRRHFGLENGSPPASLSAGIRPRQESIARHDDSTVAVLPQRCGVVGVVAAVETQTIGCSFANIFYSERMAFQARLTYP